MKKIILFLILAVSSLASWAYYFSAVAPSGQTLYYNISTGSTVYVTYPGSFGGSDAWFGYTQPTGSLTIPSSVTYSGTTYSVTSIDSYAFNGCSGLTTVTIPNSVTYIGSYAFSSVRNIIYYGTASGSPWGALSVNGYVEYPLIFSDNSKTQLLGCSSSATFVTIPNSVTSIGNSAFAGCSGLTSVTIPNSVTSIGSSAFGGCRGLTSVTIGNSVTSIGYSAFYNCSGLTSVTIGNSVTSIGYSVFEGCSGLTSIIVDANNNHYDSRNNCNAVIETATNTLICGCQNTTIPNSVTSIGERAFMGCIGLTSVTIPNSVTSIGERAFNNCSGLTSVTIGSSVTSIGSYAFSGCRGLDTIVCKASTPPTLDGSDEFYDVPTSCKVLVPCGSASAYRSNPDWNRFSNFIEQQLFSITISSADPSQGTAFVSTQPTCTSPAVITAEPNSGFTFSHWSDGNTDNPRTITLTQNTSIISYFRDRNRQFHYASMDTLYGVVSEVNPPVAFTSATVGSGTSSTYNSPFNNWYKNSTNECLYLASEIGGAGRIDTISYYVASAYSFACNDLKIYMGTTTQTNLSSGWVGFDNLQCVYSRTGTTIGRSTGWESYALDTPFEYNGTDNLIVVVCRQSSSYTNSLQYRYSTTSNMCRYRQSDSNPSSYGTLNGTASGSITSERANIRLSISNDISQREMGSTVELAATPKPGYRFFTWSDRCTDNPRSITVTQDTSVIAYFSPEPAVEYVHDTTIVHDTVFVTLFLRDSTIIYGSHDTIFVHDTVRDCHEQQLFVLVNNDTLGACAGSGSYPLGSTVQIMAIPNRGTRFLCWSDGNTDNPRTITLTGNLTFTAIFLKQEE